MTIKLRVQKVRVLTVALALLTFVGLTAPADAAPPEGILTTFVNGFIDRNVDLYLDGLHTDLAIGLDGISVAELMLAAGVHDFAIYDPQVEPPEHEVDRTDIPIHRSEVLLPSGSINAAVIVEVTEFSDDSLTVRLSSFTSRLRELPIDRGLLRVHSSLDADTIDVYSSGSLLFDDLSYGETRQIFVDPWGYPLSIRLNEETAVDVPLGTMDVGAGQVVDVYILNGAEGGRAFVTVTGLPESVRQLAGYDGEVARLYLALLGREPEAVGLRYWAGIRSSGTPLEDIAHLISTSPEFDNRFGDQLDDHIGAWIELLYRQVLGREPDNEGLVYWVTAIDAGELTRTEMIVYFSESQEFKNKTGTF